MNIADLEKFLKIADTQNLQQAAEELDSSPSVLSKSLKRLENMLSVALFDRVGKSIVLNPAGQLLRTKAAQMVAQAKQTQAEFAGLVSKNRYKVVGPSILLFKWASVISRGVIEQYPQSTLSFDSQFEQEALNKVINGTADLALITSAVESQIPATMHRAELGSITMQVAASKNHNLISLADNSTSKYDSKSEIKVTLDDLLKHSFATPNISPYCGESRGIGCDGWQNQIFPRKIQLVVNDYSVLTQLVRSGQALAYLPDYWLREWDLVRVSVTDCPYECVEKLMLMSWQEELLEVVK